MASYDGVPTQPRIHQQDRGHVLDAKAYWAKFCLPFAGSERSVAGICINTWLLVRTPYPLHQFTSLSHFTMPSDSVENKHPNLRRLKNTPVCIICARSNEAEQIAKALGYKEKISGYQVSQINNGHTFFLGSFTLQNGDELGYYVTHSTRQSVQSFLVEASILLFLLKPKHVLHAGTCAGYRGEEFQPK